MKIVNSMLAKGYGGITEVFYHYNQALTELGHDVLAVVRTNSTAEIHLTENPLPGLQTFSVASPSGIPAVFSRLTLREALKALCPDLIITHLPPFCPCSGKRHRPPRG